MISHSNDDFDSPIVRGGIWFFGLLLIVSSPIAGYFTVMGVLDGRASVDWPTTAGQVIESRVEERITPVRKGNILTETIHYASIVRYQYMAAERNNIGSKIRPFSITSTDKSEADAVITRYPLGAQVTVHYDPQDPKNALLEPGVTTKEYLLLLVPAVMLGLGVLCVVVARKMKENVYRRYREQLARKQQKAAQAD